MSSCALPHCASDCLIDPMWFWSCFCMLYCIENMKYGNRKWMIMLLVHRYLCILSYGWYICVKVIVRWWNHDWIRAYVRTVNISCLLSLPIGLTKMPVLECVVYWNPCYVVSYEKMLMYSWRFVLLDQNLGKGPKSPSCIHNHGKCIIWIENHFVVSKSLEKRD